MIVKNANEFRIRSARKKDAGAIAEVLNVQFKKGRYSRDFLKKYLNTEKKILNDMKECRYFVISNDRITGAMALKITHGTCQIDDIAIAEDFQKIGLGTKLVKFAEKYARKQKCNKLWCTSSAKLNAAKFYTRLGFRVEGRLRKHFDGNDVIVLGKLLR